MTRSLYDPSKPNHAVTCQRTACQGTDPHPGGRHLDQRDELYDGPALSLDGLPLSVRDSARRILREAPALMPELVDLANEVQFLRRQVAAVSVDKDRSVREAMARSASCEHHGREIEELGKALHAADQRAEKIERARLALLGFYQAVKDAVDQYQNRATRPDWKVQDVIKVLAGAVKKAGAAHDRAWKS